VLILEQAHQSALHDFSSQLLLLLVIARLTLACRCVCVVCRVSCSVCVVTR
jgi:hypothetical protein